MCPRLEPVLHSLHGLLCRNRLPQADIDLLDHAHSFFGDVLLGTFDVPQSGKCHLVQHTLGVILVVPAFGRCCAVYRREWDSGPACGSVVEKSSVPLRMDDALTHV